MYKTVSMLCSTFILGTIFIFFCFVLIKSYNCTCTQTKENGELNHNIYMCMYLANTKTSLSNLIIKVIKIILTAINSEFGKTDVLSIDPLSKHDEGLYSKCQFFQIFYSS